jgi:ribokinase
MDLVVRAPRLPIVGESLISHGFRTFPGGKGGNQAVAAARLGASVAIVGRVGDDDFGRALLRSLQVDGVDTSDVSVDTQTGTGVAVPIVLDDGQNAIFAIPQSNLNLGVADIEKARAAIAAADALLVQFEVGMAATETAMRAARAAGVKVFLNPAPLAAFPDGLLGLATTIVANEVEAAALVPEARGDHSAEAAALAAIAGSAVVTLGAEGAAFQDGSAAGSARAPSVAAVDSVGAGDAFCGALAVALAEGRSFSAAVHFANAAGALAVTRPGAQAALPTRDEVEALLAKG